MIENKFWSFIGIALAVMAFFYNTCSAFSLFMLGIITVIFCYIVSYILNKISASNHRWIDAIFFIFSKNKLPYIICDKIIKYSILNEKEAHYDLTCKLTSKTNSPDFCYRGRYHWDQEEEVMVSVSGNGNFTYNSSEDLKWSNVDIIPIERIVHKRENVECGFSLRNLHISKLSKHSYLSCKMIEKVKHVKLIANVNPVLNPTDEAIYIVQDAFGEEISREHIMYNKNTNSYEKTITYPRRGRKYIIKWDYKK